MASVRGVEEGIVTQAWVDKICDLYLRAESGAVQHAADSPMGIVVNNSGPAPKELLRQFEMLGDIGLHVTYSVSRGGRDYSDERASISDLRHLVRDDAGETTFSIRGDYVRGGIEVRFHEPSVWITVHGRTTHEAQAVLGQVSAALPPLPQGYWDYDAEAESEQLARTRTVFIGHGGDDQWEPVAEWVREWGYAVQCFEEEERAGKATLDIVLGMVQGSKVGLIMMTAADTLTDGTKQARPNVVHELGMCHAFLGKDRTIVILENGATFPTNIEGHIQIRYDRGELHKVRARIQKAIEREMS